MTKKLTKAVLGLAVTAVIGAGVIGANGYFVAHALAATNNQKAPVITSDVVPVETGLGNTATVVADGDGKQTIVFDEDESARVKKDLELHPSSTLEKDLALKKAAENASPTFLAGTPSAKDLTEKNAIETARSAIVKEYALTDETLSKFSTSAMLNVVDPEAPIWSITFYPTNQNDFSQIGTYNITIDSLSGKIIKIMSAADGVG